MLFSDSNIIEVITETLDKRKIFFMDFLKKTNVMTQILDYGLTTITLLPYCAETPFFVVILILKT